MKLLSYLFWGLVISISILLITTLRFHALGQIPSGINIDEASYGYDAYSLLKTGRDMWGERLLTLKSFGDYKPAGLAYTIIPFVKMYGLTTLATRLPSAIFGLLSLVMSYFLLVELIRAKWIAAISVFILALSPWHFGLSRLFYEPNVGLFFIILAIYFLLKYLDKFTPKTLLYVAVAIALGGYYYSVLRYIGIALVATALVLANYLAIPRLIKHGLVFLFIWALFALPYLPDMFGARGLVRLGQEGKMHEFGDVLVITENRQMCYLGSGKNQLVAKWCYALWNKPGEKIVAAAKTFAELLSPKYLFLNGYQKDVVPANYGAYLEILIPAFLVGLYVIVLQSAKNLKYRFIISAWLISSIPVAIAGAQNIHRNVVGLYFVFLIIAIGLHAITKYLISLRSKAAKLAITLFICLAFIWSQSRYLASYFYVYTNVQPEIWQRDSEELMTWLSKNSEGRSISFYDFDFGPLLYAFYTQMDPSIFRSQAVWSDLNDYGWTHLNRIGEGQQNASNIWIDICKAGVSTNPSKLLVVTGEKSQWQELVLFKTRNFADVHTLHAVYDSKTLYDFLYRKDPSSLKAACSSLK